VNDVASTAGDDDYDLFADAVKCHNHSAHDAPATPLEQPLNDHNLVVC